ncbi:MAG: hypothetical protein ACNS61_07310 [Candidatus Wenzhouxiangella sp. M2_3B_020]
MQMTRPLAFCAIAVWLTAGPAFAQEEAEAPESPPTPACTTDASPYRDFDFWVGDWEVFDPESDRKLGENTITLREKGCLIVERWNGARGGTGMSMNFYDPLKKAWRQVWQSPWGFIDYTGGADEQGRMVLEGTIHSNARGTSSDFRGRWTPNDDGTVLQEFWQRNAETGEWDPWFVGEYRPREDSLSSVQPSEVVEGG